MPVLSLALEQIVNDGVGVGVGRMTSRGETEENVPRGIHLAPGALV